MIFIVPNFFLCCELYIYRRLTIIGRNFFDELQFFAIFVKSSYFASRLIKKLIVFHNNLSQMVLISFL